MQQSLVGHGRREADERERERGKASEGVQAIGWRAQTAYRGVRYAAALSLSQAPCATTGRGLGAPATAGDGSQYKRRGAWMLEAGCWTLDAGCWMGILAWQDVGGERPRGVGRSCCTTHPLASPPTPSHKRTLAHSQAALQRRGLLSAACLVNARAARSW